MPSYKTAKLSALGKRRLIVARANKLRQSQADDDSSTTRAQKDDSLLERFRRRVKDADV